MSKRKGSKALLDQHDGTRSRAHRFVEQLLTEMRISYMSECEEFAPFRLDLYLPEWHMAIEIDGPSHTQSRDQFRDQRMFERYSVKTYRMRSDKLVKRADIEAFIKRSIEDASLDSDERRKAYMEHLARN